MFRMRGFVLISVLTLSVAQTKITSLTVDPKSLEEHQTSFYNMQDGFVVRRGQSFDVLVETDAEIDTTQATFSIFEDSGTTPSLLLPAIRPSFSTTFARKAGESQYALRVSTPVDSPIGKYENIKFTMQVSGKKSTFSYDSPLYLIFNSFSSEDKDVYLPNHEHREEYLLNEYGNVCQGSVEDHSCSKWHYGQSNQLALDAAFHLLKSFPCENKANAIKVAQTIQKNQGMIRPNTMTGPKMVGTEDAILEGNWGFFNFTETEGLGWTSVVDILKRWKETGLPAKYGQCWVFAALQNTLMRTIGIGSRQISAFGSPMDASQKHDKEHKLHHVLDSYYDMEGNLIFMDGQAWNFHSWNEIWLSRPGNNMDGWQSLDGTPSGAIIGPAPTKAVKALLDDADFNVSHEVSTVHASLRTYLVKCGADHKKADKLKGCTAGKLVKYDHSGLKLITSSKTLSNGTAVVDNITSQFIDPTTDAFIPYSGTGKDDRADDILRMADGKDAISIKPDTYDITVGDDIRGVVEIDTDAFAQGDLVDFSMMFTLETSQKIFIKQLESLQQRVLIKGSKMRVPWALDNSAYLQGDLNDVYVKIVAIADGGANRTFFDSEMLDIDAPEVIITTQPEVQAGSNSYVPFEATFTNPLDFDLDNVCVTVHSHDLQFEGKSPDVTKVSKCVDLRSRETMLVKSTLLAPAKVGPCYLLATVVADFLPASSSHMELRAVEVLSTQSNTAVVVGVSIGCVIGLALLVGLVCYFSIRRRAAAGWAADTGMTAELQAP